MNDSLTTLPTDQLLSQAEQCARSDDDESDLYGDILYALHLRSDSLIFDTAVEWCKSSDFCMRALGLPSYHNLDVQIATHLIHLATLHCQFCCRCSTILKRTFFAVLSMLWVTMHPMISCGTVVNWWHLPITILPMSVAQWPML